MKQISYWHDEMSEETARAVLGSAHFDWAIEQGAAFCAGRAAGAWQANTPESFGAYKTAQRIAETKATERRDYGAAVLNAFDRMQHDADRGRRERAAEVRRKARNSL